MLQASFGYINNDHQMENEEGFGVIHIEKKWGSINEELAQVHGQITMPHVGGVLYIGDPHSHV